MPQPDLMGELRESRPLASDALREHVRQIAAQATEPKRPRSFNWRRALVIAVPVAAAAVGASLLIGGGNRQAAVRSPHLAELAPVAPPALGPPLTTQLRTGHGASSATAATGAAQRVEPIHSPGVSNAASSGTAEIPATNANRVQRVSATLELRLPNTQAVSDASKRAVAITRALGGFASRLEVDASGASGYADLTLRVPKRNLQKAVARFSALGTITGENVSLEDIGAQIDATTAKLARLWAQRASWRAQPQSPETERHIAALSAQIARLRGSRTATIRNASYATVSLELATRVAPSARPHGRSHFHGLLVAFRWVGIYTVYALALGAPLVLLVGLVWVAIRLLRRRREDALLSRP